MVPPDAATGLKKTNVSGNRTPSIRPSVMGAPPITSVQNFVIAVISAELMWRCPIATLPSSSGVSVSLRKFDGAMIALHDDRPGFRFVRIDSNRGQALDLFF